MKQKRIITEDFFVGNLGNPEATQELIEACKSRSKPAPGGIDANNLSDLAARKCGVCWIDVTQSNFIEHGFKKIVSNINSMIWKFPVKNEWEADLQYTTYTEGGDHYKWHVDNFKEDCSDRRISIVYCLSKKSNYTGGEFDLRKKSNDQVYTTKFDYGDFIVFPSDTFHRVRPLKSGIRTTLVGWYR